MSGACTHDTDHRDLHRCADCGVDLVAEIDALTGQLAEVAKERDRWLARMLLLEARHAAVRVAIDVTRLADNSSRCSHDAWSCGTFGVALGRCVYCGTPAPHVNDGADR